MDLHISGENERPEPVQVIKNLKERYGIGGRTVRVVGSPDSSQNFPSAIAIADAACSGNGYLRLKTADQLDERDVASILSKDDWEDCENVGNGTGHLCTKSATIEVTYRFAGEDGTVDTATLTETHVATFSEGLRDDQLREIDRVV